MEISDAQAFLDDNHRAVLHTYRRDGSPQLSPVTIGVDDDGHAIVSTRATAMKTKNVERDPRVALCVLTDAFFGEWHQLDGRAEIVRLPEAMDLLVEYYRRISGEHPDWDDYRAAMERDQRVILRIAIERAGPSVSG
jgi:PPOX class probable F420-dependent enzyme